MKLDLKGREVHKWERKIVGCIMKWQFWKHVNLWLLCQKSFPQHLKMKFTATYVYMDPGNFRFNLSFFHIATKFQSDLLWNYRFSLLKLNKNINPDQTGLPAKWPVGVVKLWHKHFNHIKGKITLCSYIQWYCKWVSATVRCSYCVWTT